MAVRLIMTVPEMRKWCFKSWGWARRLRHPPSENKAMTSRRSFLAALGAVPAAALQRTPPQQNFWTREYWADKGDGRLYMFRKRREAPRQGESPSPVLSLVHGSSISGRSTFDLHVPNKS